MRVASPGKKHFPMEIVGAIMWETLGLDTTINVHRRPDVCEIPTTTFSTSIIYCPF